MRFIPRPGRFKILTAVLAAASMVLKAGATDLLPNPLLGDLANPLNALWSVNPGNGSAQEFTINSGQWTLTAAHVVLGNQDPVNPVTPLLQVRGVSGINGGPNQTLLGTFSINPNDIPTFTFGENHFASVPATPDFSFSLGPGTYWLCLINSAAIGGFQAGFSTIDPLLQQGGDGTVINLNGLAFSLDTGGTFGAPGTSGSAMLMDLFAQPAPEPSPLSLIPCILLAWRLRLTFSERN